VNLLQPQDRRSPDAGDSKAAVAARARLLGSGVGRSMVDAFVVRAAALDTRQNPLVCDLGCGSGDVLGTLATQRSVAGVGIDLSVAAIDDAAHRFPQLTWVVANADRRLPLLAESVNVVLSLHARRNPIECARVVAAGGFLLVAVPAPDDLVELRERIQGKPVLRDRGAALIAEHERLFTVVDRHVVRTRQHLGREQLIDVLHGTYRGIRAAAAAKVETLGDLDVTLASDLCLFQRK
jgi:23S rRNA (guanine745-N1)-methyltransferase